MDAPDPLRTMLITGAAGGIGRATVSHFAERGWRVIGVDRAPFGAGFPASGLFIQADISIGDNLAGIFQQAHEFTGRSTPALRQGGRRGEGGRGNRPR